MKAPEGPRRGNGSPQSSSQGCQMRMFEVCTKETRHVLKVMAVNMQIIALNAISPENLIDHLEKSHLFLGELH